MAIVMSMRWDGVTPEEYDAVRESVGWERQAPAGGLMHIAWFAEGGMRITDAWETAEDFQRFVDERLMPGVKQLGIEGEPEVRVDPAHAVFNPGVARGAPSAV